MDERLAALGSFYSRSTDLVGIIKSNGAVIKIDSTETQLTGKWIPDGQQGFVGDDTCQRIDALVRTHLKELRQNTSGWDTLYRDPDDGRLWELIYPQSELHGGGPPQLRCLSLDETRVKYGMHPSYFQLLNHEADVAKELSLPAEISEWLFHVKFWDAINVELKSNFGQYEDDTLSSSDAAVVLREIDKLTDTCLRDPTYSQKVVYGWTPEGKILELSTSGLELRKGIEELRAFLTRAIQQKSDVFCQL